MLLYLCDSLLVLLLTAVIGGLLVGLTRFGDYPTPPKTRRRGPRLLRPHTPDDCALWRTAATTPAPAAGQALIPYGQIKSSRGRKKSVSTAGFACPYEGCRSFNNADPAVHALVGYGITVDTTRSKIFTVRPVGANSRRDATRPSIT
jgi:hypothetical protein